VGCVRDLTGERFFCFGAEVTGNGNDAGDVGGAVGVDVTGVGVGGLGGSGSLWGCLLAEGDGGGEEKGGGERLQEDSP
jgi:hypothetical protein